MKSWSNKILLPLFFFLLFYSVAYAGPYLDSAHGNSTYGVKRNVPELNSYARGNCAHCHEQHASIGGSEPQPASGNPSKYLLFESLFTSQAATFCYGCHKDPSNSWQVSMPNQYCYSRKYGGDTTITCPDDIKEAFQFVDTSGTPQLNCNSSNGSSHFLDDIRKFLKNKWAYGSDKDNINPCAGCHNPHRVQRASYPIAAKGTSPISRPAAHASNWDLWGDDTTERMSSYTSNYQAPYYHNSTSTYEPNGDATSDGSNMPDYVTFCTDCHNPSYDGQVSSSQKYNFTNNWQALIYNPDWNVSPHGWTDGNKQDTKKRKAPYNAANKNYVLSCTDCHEPHGSSNGMLIRKEVNGQSTVTFQDWSSRSDWLSLCQRCHKIGSGHQDDNPCYICHMHNKNWFKPI